MRKTRSQLLITNSGLNFLKELQRDKSQKIRKEIEQKKEEALKRKQQVQYNARGLKAKFTKKKATGLAEAINRLKLEKKESGVSKFMSRLKKAVENKGQDQNKEKKIFGLSKKNMQILKKQIKLSQKKSPIKRPLQRSMISSRKNYAVFDQSKRFEFFKMQQRNTDEINDSRERRKKKRAQLAVLKCKRVRKRVKDLAIKRIESRCLLSEDFKPPSSLTKNLCPPISLRQSLNRKHQMKSYLFNEKNTRRNNSDIGSLSYRKVYVRRNKSRSSTTNLFEMYSRRTMAF